MTDNVTPISNDTVTSVQQEMEAYGLTQATVAKESGVTSARLNQWLRRRYKGDVAKIDNAMQRWLESRKRQATAASQLPQAPDWIRTPSAARIWACLSYAQMAGDMTITYGGAGVSKTKTANAYAASSPNVWIATMSPDCKSVATALEEISYAVGVQIHSGAARMRRAIERHIKDTQGLLVIDDCQSLGIEALDAIRSLHDRTDIGIALLGNETAYARMTGGNRAAYLDRLFSRIGKRVRIVRPTQKDVDQVIKAWGVEGKAERDLLRKIATGAGALRRLTKVMRVASMFAAGAGESVGEEHIRAAVKDLEDDSGERA